MDSAVVQGSLFGPQLAEADGNRQEVTSLIPKETLSALPSRYQRTVEQAAMLYRFLENKENINFASIFTGLLGLMDEAIKGLINHYLEPRLPVDIPSQKAWFEPYFPLTVENHSRLDHCYATGVGEFATVLATGSAAT